MAETTHAMPAVIAADRDSPTREALTEMTEAWHAIEAARRFAYEYHRHAGSGDAHLVRAVGLLRRDGHHDLADAICHRLIGHGVAEDRWALQVSEEDDEFSRTMMTLEEQVRSRGQTMRPASGGRAGGGGAGLTDPEI
jgi:hypothetical protein